MSTATDPRFPVGKFDHSANVPHEGRAALIDSIARAPGRMRDAVHGLSDVQLDTPYREGGWTVRQVVHHVPESHMNAYIRMKLALTEDVPAIKTYEEQLWAELVDARTAPVDMSLQLLEALHVRWVLVLRSLSNADFQRAVVHPQWGNITNGKLLQLYEWHGRHHVAHITALRERKGW
jgi:uncharacterized damage-inducible protein DinB